MRVLNFGSLNIDFVYQVEHFVRRGETLSSRDLQLYAGGKGLNQSVALARAGADVWHAGCIGKDGLFLLDLLQEAGVQTDYVHVLEDVRTGNAIIQSDVQGDNCILLYGGANQCVTKAQIDDTLHHFAPGDWLILQNEINHLSYLVERARKQGLCLVLNPSPMDEKIFDVDLRCVDWLILNEIEAAGLLGRERIDPQESTVLLRERFPAARFVLTLGEEGACYVDADRTLWKTAYSVPVADTTGAGDTFSGYFFASILEGKTIETALDVAAKAAAIAVSKPGAADSIPHREEVLD